MIAGRTVAAIIPALNEAATIAAVVHELSKTPVDHIVVVDNGSTDDTQNEARAAGAVVVEEPRRGYGSACLRGIAITSEYDVVLFIDGDGSDDPSDVSPILQALVETPADLVVGSRTLGTRERGALTPVQRMGNLLTCGLVYLFWRRRFTDLGPLRAITRGALRSLAMSDPDFGWTIEMQVKAAQQGLRYLEVPVTYRRRRGGVSKVSGTLVGSYRAGRRILGYVLTAKLAEVHSQLTKAIGANARR